jgi:hypothetical protein
MDFVTNQKLARAVHSGGVGVAVINVPEPANIIPLGVRLAGAAITKRR